VGYPDNVLAGDEQVVLHRHPHWKRLFWPAVVLILSSAAASFGCAVVSGTTWDANAKQVVYWVIGAIWIAPSFMPQYSSLGCQVPASTSLAAEM